MPKKLPRRWRGVFLRALGRSGNARASAFAAGVDPGTAYDHRIKDAGFRGKWDAALEKFKSRPSPRPRSRPPDGIRPASGRGSPELIPRRTKAGEVQMVKAAEGRWNSETEAAFLAGLRETGCVRAAADAAGLSTTAFYNHRANYPEFAERWEEMIAESKTRLPELLNAASIASMDPGVPRRGRRLPKVNVDQAIRISQMNLRAAAAAKNGRGRGARLPRVATNAEVREALVKRLAAFRQRIRARQAARKKGLGDPDAEEAED